MGQSPPRACITKNPFHAQGFQLLRAEHTSQYVEIPVFGGETNTPHAVLGMPDVLMRTPMTPQNTSTLFALCTSQIQNASWALLHGIKANATASE